VVQSMYAMSAISRRWSVRCTEYQGLGDPIARIYIAGSNPAASSGFSFFGGGAFTPILLSSLTPFFAAEISAKM
jgi:hypothetical protein